MRRTAEQLEAWVAACVARETTLGFDDWVAEQNHNESDAEWIATEAFRLAAENKRLRETLHTAWLMVKDDATDAPGRISHAIRPFLEAAITREGSA